MTPLSALNEFSSIYMEALVYSRRYLCHKYNFKIVSKNKQTTALFYSTLL